MPVSQLYILFVQLIAAENSNIGAVTSQTNVFFQECSMFLLHNNFSMLIVILITSAQTNMNISSSLKLMPRLGLKHENVVANGTPWYII